MLSLIVLVALMLALLFVFSLGVWAFARAPGDNSTFFAWLFKHLD